MATSHEHLTVRQEKLGPEKVTRQVAGLGTLHGWKFPNGVQQFFCIPYATISKNWTRATLQKSWENGEHDGTRIGDPVRPYAHLNPPDEDDQNNCLTVSLTIPPGAEKLPVMVFIHGGGFMYGSASLPTYDGFRFVSESVRKNKPVILATINYRLGLFGFLASKDIARGLAADGFEGNGNFALTDQQTALYWINKHIGLFGGDPDRVTIFGESAGGWSVGSQWYAEKPAPFQRVIHHSGSPAGFSVWSEEQHEQFYAKVLQYFGIERDAPEALARLQKVPSREINAATLDLYGALEPLPSLCLDGWFWKEGYTPGPTSWNAPAPWLKGFMLGHCGSEGVIWRDVLMEASFQGIVEAFHRHLSPESTDFIFALYGLHEDVSCSERLKILEEMFSDQMFYVPDLARAHNIADNNTDVPSYFFRFDEKSFHSYDLLFIFLTNYERFNEEQRYVADAMHEAWVSFAHGEEPWEEYKVSRRWRIWGPDGRIQLVTEREDEAAHKTSRIKTLIRRKDVLPGFCLAMEDLSVKRYLVCEDRPKGWAKALFAELL
ncbi:Alpha/Beta hydrolase protein [Aspergillus terricola var. indicus]